jgi:hypothetical protein
MVVSSTLACYVIMISFDILLRSEGLTPQNNFTYACVFLFWPICVLILKMVGDC